MSRNTIVATILAFFGSLTLFSGCGREVGSRIADERTVAESSQRAVATKESYDANPAEPSSSFAETPSGDSGGEGYSQSPVTNAAPTDTSSSSESAGSSGDASGPAPGGPSAEGALDVGGLPASDGPAKPASRPSYSGDKRHRSDEGKKTSPVGGDEKIVAEEAEATEDRQRMAKGLLTAGSFDDHERLDDFLAFLTRSQQNDPSEVLPRMAVGQRILIHVHNGQGEPISNAQVYVAAESDPQRQLMSAKTGTDGRTLFVTGRDAIGVAAQEYAVNVQIPDHEPITKIMSANQADWRFEVNDAQAERPQQLDLALVIDATGSMGDELNYLKIEIDHIATTVKKMFPNVDQRFSLVLYRDAGDAYVTRVFDFTSSLSDFRGTLSKQIAAGGGDYPEAMHLAMENATKLSWRAGNTARVMFLIGDAPPHDQDAERAMAAAEKLRQQNVRVFPVAASGAAWKAEYVLRSTAFLTLGQYLFLTDHSGVGNPHAAPHVPDYQVEHLNRLMVRMVAQELAGKKLVPQEVIAIERGDASPLQFQPRPLAQQSTPEQQTSMVNPPIMKCGTPDLPAAKPAYLNFTVNDFPIDRLTMKWIVYGLAICGIIFLGAIATRA